MLRQDRARGAAPHKPLLLLVALDLLEQGKLDAGLIPRDGNLAFRFSSGQEHGDKKMGVAVRFRRHPPLMRPTNSSPG
jgi:hypothetical protein